MTPFMNKFGVYSESKKAYYLPSRTASLMNSLPLLGKFTGTVIVGPIIERIGHRRSMGMTCLVQIVGAISEYPGGRSSLAKDLLTRCSSSHEQQRRSICYRPIPSVYSRRAG